MSKKTSVIVGISVVLCLAFLYFLGGFTGHVIYNADTACDGTMGVAQGDSSFSAPQDCASLFSNNGLEITSSNILDCNTNYIVGIQGFGLKISATSVKVRRCTVNSFDYNLDIFQSGSEMIDSNLISGITKNIRLTSSITATLINTSYETDGSVTIGAGSKLLVKNYARVRVINATSLAGISGANVNIINASADATNTALTTDGSGYAYVNITERTISNPGVQTVTDYNYNISATNGASSNSTMWNVVSVNSNRNVQEVVLALTDPAPSNPTSILINITSPRNITYGNQPIYFNVTLLNQSASQAFSSCYYSFISNAAKTYAETILDPLHATALNASMLRGNYTAYFWCNDTFGNINNTQNVTFTIDWPLDITVNSTLSPITSTDQQYNNNETFCINATSVSALDSCFYNLDSSATPASTAMTIASNKAASLLNATLLGVSNHTVYFWCNATDGTINNTEKLNISIIHIPIPLALQVINPEPTTYGNVPVDFNVAGNENLTECKLSLDNFTSNLTMTVSGKNATYSSALSISNYTASFWCASTEGTVNNTEKQNFTVYWTTITPPGGGGGGTTCTDTCSSKGYECGTQTICASLKNCGSCLTGNTCQSGACVPDTCNESKSCSDWSGCSNSIKTRTCNRCNSTTTEQLSCDSRTCRDECNFTGDRCFNSTRLESCNSPGTCFKYGYTDCKLGCSNNRCNPEIESPLALPLNITTQQVAIAASVPVAVGIGLWFWLVMGFLMTAPLYMRRLRHYSVSILDMSNSLKFRDNKNSLNKINVIDFLNKIKQKSNIIFAERTLNLMKFLIDGGFLEVQTEYPSVVTGHFTRKSDAKKFKGQLQEIIDKIPARERPKIIESVERASIFGIIREMRRKKRTEKEINKLRGNN